MPQPDAAPDIDSVDDELRRRGLVPMLTTMAAFGQKTGEFLAVSEDQARAHEALGTAERTSDTKERVKRAERHLAKVTKKAGLRREPTMTELCQELQRRGWVETSRGWVKAT